MRKYLSYNTISNKKRRQHNKKYIRVLFIMLPPATPLTRSLRSNYELWIF